MQFPLIEIPDDWWEDKKTRETLLGFRHKPSFDIPDDWWEDKETRFALFNFQYKPSFDIPDDWWEDDDTRVVLFNFQYKPSFDIPDDWWEDGDTQYCLLKLGYVRPTPPPFPLSPPKSSSITPLSTTLPTKEVVVEDTPSVTLPSIPSDPLHIAPLPSDTLPAAPETNGASAVAEAQQPPVQTLTSSQTAAQAVPPTVPIDVALPTPNPLPTVSSVNGSTPDVGTRSSGQRLRSRVVGFFKRVFHRP